MLLFFCVWSGIDRVFFGFFNIFFFFFDNSFLCFLCCCRKKISRRIFCLCNTQNNTPLVHWPIRLNSIYQSRRRAVTCQSRDDHHGTHHEHRGLVLLTTTSARGAVVFEERKEERRKKGIFLKVVAISDLERKRNAGRR